MELLSIKVKVEKVYFDNIAIRCEVTTLKEKYGFAQYMPQDDLHSFFDRVWYSMGRQLKKAIEKHEPSDEENEDKWGDAMIKRVLEKEKNEVKEGEVK